MSYAAEGIHLSGVVADSVVTTPRYPAVIEPYKGGNGSPFQAGFDPFAVVDKIGDRITVFRIGERGFAMTESWNYEAKHGYGWAPIGVSGRNCDSSTRWLSAPRLLHNEQSHTRT